jgi:hypothetical protein
MFWAFPKNGALALAAAAGAALLAGPAEGTYIESCNQQQKCIKWEVTKLTGKNCGIKPNDCPIKICLVIDDDDGCNLAWYSKVDQICDNANGDGCVRPAPWIGTGGGRDADSGSCSCSSNWYGPFAFDTVCKSVGEGTKFCQIGKPSQTLNWNMYVRHSFRPVMPRSSPANQPNTWFSFLWQRGRERQR